PRLQHRVHGRLKMSELLDHAWLLLQAVEDFATGPTGQGRGLDQPQPMSKLAEQVRERKCLDVLSLDALHEAMAHRAEARVRLEMIDENVRIHKDAGPPPSWRLEQWRSTLGLRTSRSGPHLRENVRPAVVGP